METKSLNMETPVFDRSPMSTSSLSLSTILPTHFLPLNYFRPSAPVRRRLSSSNNDSFLIESASLYRVDDLPFKMEHIPPTNYGGGFKEKVAGLEVGKTIAVLDQLLRGLFVRGSVQIPSFADLASHLSPTLDQDGNPATSASLVGGIAEVLQKLTKFASGCTSHPNKGTKSGNNDSIFGAKFSCKISSWLAMGCLSPRMMFDGLKKSVSRMEFRRTALALLVMIFTGTITADALPVTPPLVALLSPPPSTLPMQALSHSSIGWIASGIFIAILFFLCICFYFHTQLYALWVRICVRVRALVFRAPTRDSLPLSCMVTYPTHASIGFGARQCHICLLDFVAGGTVRVLPRCMHIYHITCIAEWWARGEITCPDCRFAYPIRYWEALDP